VRDADRARWGRRRRGEAAQALRRLNIPADALHAIGWPDMGLTALLREQPAFARARLIEELTSFRPTVVALPALSDRHPDHGSAHVLVRLALAAGGVEPPLLLGYLVHGRESPAPRLALSPAGAWHAAKLAALSAHASQMALSAGRMRRLADRPERYERVARPPLGRRAGALPWRPGILRARLRLTVASPDGVRHWRWADAPLQQRDGQGHYRLTEVPTAPCFARLDMAVASPWIFDRWGWCEL
jgi:LmbE family N-acetylglucosaminyl deacetylase